MGSLFLIVILLPLFALISLVIKLTSRGPVLHISERIGKGNQNFNMPKFRTMSIDTPQLATHLLKDGKKYTTRVGKILRKTSLDELPQLFSVLKGEMSFVGPRPALFNQFDLKNLRTQSGVDSLVPGITGWAQINGRDDIELSRKVELDLYYLNHQSFSFDLIIIFKTIFKVFFFSNITH